MAASVSSWSVSEPQRSRAHALGRALALAMLLSGRPAAAEDAASCVLANDSGNDHRLRGQLIAAKAEFLKCAAASCPEIIRQECAAAVTRVVASTPTIVIAVTDADGKDVSAGRVYVDGEERADAQTGRAMAIDPGEHRIRFSASDGRSTEASFIAREGEKNRTVRVALSSASAAPADAGAPRSAAATVPGDAPRSSYEPPWTAWAAGGAGLAAVGSFAFFALRGKAQERDLEQRCAPDCPDAEVDELYRKYLIADLSLGVSVIALGVATYLFLESSPSRGRPRISVMTGRSGAVLGTTVSF
jgi:hypothetical protein